MDNSYVIRKPLCKNFFYKNLPRLEKPELPEPSQDFRVSALKISPLVKTKRPVMVKTSGGAKDKSQTQPSLNIKMPQKSGILQNSTSQESLNIDSHRAYWKKLEETDNRLQLATRTSMFRRDNANYIIKTLYMPQTMKNVLGKNPVSQCSKYRKFLNSLENDPYHASNISSLTKTTSFYDLLNIHYENPTFFPYFNKNTRELTKDTVVIPIKFPATSTFEESLIEPIKKPSIKTKLFFPSLKNQYLNKQSVTCPYNFLIINFESINVNNSIVLRPGIIENLRVVSVHFHIIIITSDFEDRVLDIKEDLEFDDVKISGIYSVTGATGKTCKILDFSQIFQDFDIHEPAKACIFISHHLIVEDVDEGEYIGNLYGSSLKLNCEKIPVVRQELSSVPVEILMPSLQSGKSIELFEKVCMHLVNYLNRHFYLRLKLDFEAFLKKKFRVVHSELPRMMLKKHLATEHYFFQAFNTDIKHWFIVN